jgi:hypothetical protein
MSKDIRMFAGCLVGVLLLVSVSAGATTPDLAPYAGSVVAVDPRAGTIVVGDMGPAQGDGTGPIVRRTITVTPSTEFVRVSRAPGVAPSGYVGDFVETRVPAWNVNPGDYVAVTVNPAGAGTQALKVAIVDTSR